MLLCVLLFVCVTPKSFKSAQSVRFNNCILLLDDQTMSSKVLVPYRRASGTCNKRGWCLCSSRTLHPVAVLPCYPTQRPPWVSPLRCRRLWGLEPTGPLEFMYCWVGGVGAGLRVKE